MLLLFGWMLALLGAPATVMGTCTETANSEYTILVDAASSCEATSGNMLGCQTDANGICTIPNPTPGGDPIVVTVTPSNAVGEVPAFPDLVSWTATGPVELGNKLVDLSIFLGATAGGTCAWAYTPGANSDTGMAFQKSETRYQKVNGIFFCSDFTAPPPALALFVLSKTVMVSGGTCGTDDVEVLEVNTGTQVEYCFSVKNVGAGNSSDVVLADPDVFAENQLLGSIAAGAPATVVVSDPVTITETGEITNTATVTWVNSEDPSLTTGTVSDTSKLVSSTAIETCPDEYQDLVDGTIQGAEDFFGFAALYDPNAPERVALCAPSGSPGIQCIDECIIKTACKDDPEAGTSPEDPACVEPNYQCEQSGAWSVGSYEAQTCTDQSGTGGTPYCWELAADPDKDCYYNPVQVMKKHMLVIEQIHQNPFCFFATTVNIDGTSTTVKHCF